jgi:cation diffusion facilitator family transporter
MEQNQHDEGLSGSVATRGADAAREKRWVALTSVVAAVFLTCTKIIVGVTTGSLGILAEAAHSGLDLVAAVITYFAVQFSDKPADEEHRYGHGKVENLSALIETLLLLATCGWIVTEAAKRLFFKDVPVEATIWSFLVIVFSIVIDISRSRALMRAAKKHGSQALEADALHFSTDVWSSAVVLLGLTLVKIGDWTGYTHVLERADAVAALVVALIVVWVSIKLGRRTIDALLDQAPAGKVAEIERLVRQISGVLNSRHLRLRQSGNQVFVDLVIDVRRGLSLESSHAIGSAVEECIRAALPSADIVVHVEPLADVGETPAERIRAIAVNEGQTVHNVLVSADGDRSYIELHVEMDERLDLQEAHRRVDRLEAALMAGLPGVTGITTHIEPHRGPHEPLQDVTDTSTGLIRHVRQMVAQTPGIVECHDVAVRRAGHETFLALHCTFAAGLSIREVHAISTQLEERLRAAIPHLARVTTHAEPGGAG